MRTNIKVGPAGWSYPDWRSVVYPRHRGVGFHEAAYLARFFSTIEINTSFYQPLRPELTRLWVKKVEASKNFQFTAKLYRGFTHERRLTRADILRFSEGLAPLADTGRLGCLLMQFPFSFRQTRENRDFLARLGKAFGHYPLVAEVRHSSWNMQSTLDWFGDHRIGFCNIDQPQLDHCLPPTAHATSPIGYVRLHGRNYHEWFNFGQDRTGHGGLRAVDARYNYLYTTAQLEKWKQRVEQVAAQTGTTYVVTNNHFQGKAAVNALQLMEMLSGDQVEVPEELLRHYPELHKTARRAPIQKCLFIMPPPRREPHGFGIGARGPVLAAH